MMRRMSTDTAPQTRLRALDAATMCEAFQLTVADHGDVLALRSQGGGLELTWREYGERVRRTAAGLAALGVKRGDTVGLMLTNRPEFFWFDSAAMHLGATAFSIYNTSAPEQIEYLLGDAANAVVITERAFADRILAAKPSLPTLEHVIVIEDDELPSNPDFDFEAAWRATEPEDVLTLIYTSGTTGPPKGVQITHHNMMSMVRLWDQLAPTTTPGGPTASYLPMAHTAERGNSHYHAIPRATTVTSIPDPAQVIAALPDIRPTSFVGVPRVWEKLKAALEASGAAEADPALVREQLGFGDLELAVTGAAPIPVEVLEFFRDLGIPICEVWGMSETSAVVTANPIDAMKFGTVGKPLPGTELKLADDGEVLVRGPNIMLGYRNAPEKTREAIDFEGWLHTGDVGELDEDGYLRIVDRKKELIINAAGKNMSPANIEARIKSASPLIGQAVAIGDRRPYNVALITLDPDGAAGRDPSDPALLEEIREAVDRANAQLSRVEQIKRFEVLPQEWLPGGDELTPTMKLKRKPIAEKYAAEIEALYGAGT